MSLLSSVLPAGTAGRVLACLAIGAASLASWPALAVGVRIALPATAVVSGPQVRLGQVAQVAGEDLGLVQQLVGVPLGTLPANGNPIVLERTRLARWLQTQTGVREGQIEWAGEMQTRVSAATQKVSTTQMVEAAREELGRWLATHSERYELRLVSDLKDVTVPAGMVRMATRLQSYARPQRRMQVWVDTTDAHGTARATPLIFEVFAYAHAAVARRDALAGSNALSVASDEELELTGLSKQAQRSSALQSSSQGALRLRRNMKAGDAIAASDLEPIPAVQRGEWVLLRTVDGNVAIEGRAEALQDAQIGQSVRVKLAAADRSVLARVAGIGAVEIVK